MKPPQNKKGPAFNERALIILSEISEAVQRLL